tara:strand:+ start:80 stop:481 length:402 start_codon:yes stop_codon:yes gene_type:complete
MKPPELKQLIKEEIRSVLNENLTFSNRKANIKNARQTQLLVGRVLNRMRGLNSSIKVEIIEALKEDLERLKDLLLLVHVDHPSVKGALEYVYEIQQKTKDMDPMEVASLLGSGEVIEEFIQKVKQPIKKIFIV